MGFVLANQAALVAAAETVYGTKVTSTDGLLVTDDADITHDDTFNEVNSLRLSSSGEAPARQHNKIDLSANVRIGPMQDVDSGRPSIHALMIASGHAFTEAGVGGAGSGNFIEYTPKSSGFGSASLIYYYKDESTGNRSTLDMLGYRCNATFSITPDEDFTIAVEGSALHGFPGPFATPTPPTGYGLSLGSWPNKCWSGTIDIGGGAENVRVVSVELVRGLEPTANTGDVTACGDGVSEIEATSGQIVGTLVIELEAKHLATSGTDNIYYAIHENDLDCELVLVRDDGVQTLTITVPKARFTEVQIGNGDKRRQLTMPFIAQPTSGDDEYSIRWEVV
jgi:hypothetical protein